MTQRQVELGKQYLKVIKNQNKRKINEDSLKKLKRRLFSEEQVVVPEPEEVVSFIGYRFPNSVYYRCSKCFIEALIFKLSAEGEKNCLEEHCSVGEISLQEFRERKYSQFDDNNICELCKTNLTIIRSYSSNHLDFVS